MNTANTVTDMEKELFAAAAAAKKTVALMANGDPISSRTRLILENRIREQVEWALNGEIHVEDAILHLNQICGTETATAEPKFIYNNPQHGNLNQGMMDPY